MFNWFRRSASPLSATREEVEIVHEDVESIFDLLHRVPWQDREAFSVTLALTDMLHAKKFGGDAGFAAIADEAQREELGSALQKAMYTEGLGVPGANLSALAWRVYADRLAAVIIGDQQLSDRITSTCALPSETRLEISSRPSAEVGSFASRWPVELVMSDLAATPQLASPKLVRRRHAFAGWLRLE